MSLPVAVAIFAIVVLVLVVAINRAPWDADELWKRQEERLRAQGIVAQRPDDWEELVAKQRATGIYGVLAIIVLITIWFMVMFFRVS